MTLHFYTLGYLTAEFLFVERYSSLGSTLRFSETVSPQCSPHHCPRCSCCGHVHSSSAAALGNTRICRVCNIPWQFCDFVPALSSSYALLMASLTSWLQHFFVCEASRVEESDFFSSLILS